MAQGFMKQANSLQKSDDAPALLTSINNEILANSFLDTSALQTLIAPIEEKAARLKEEEIEQLQAILNDKNNTPTIGSIDDDINIQADGTEGESEQDDSQDNAPSAPISLTSEEDEGDGDEENTQNNNDEVNIFNIVPTSVAEPEKENDTDDTDNEKI